MEDIDGGLHPAVDGQSLDEDEDEDEDKAASHCGEPGVRISGGMCGWWTWAL